LDLHERVMELAARRGFLWPAYEIYGGLSGFYDYGPLGASMKKNLEDVWREHFVVREGFMEIFSPTVGPEEVFLASGHVSNFVDPMVECGKCHQAFRADHLVKEATGMETDGLTYNELDEAIAEEGITCPECGGSFGEVWSYNLMFKTHIGPRKHQKVGYLRPETAQAMFILFNRLYGFYRKKLPFGVSQLGKAYRNEISPRQGVIRLREFSQAEVEIFVDPEEKEHPGFEDIRDFSLTMVPDGSKEGSFTAAQAVEKGIVCHQYLAYYLVLTQRFLEDVGIPPERIRFRQHKRTEMAHYAADCWDAEVYTDRFGWVEMVGIADRTDYDLKAHMEASGADLTAFVQYEEPRHVKRKTIEPKMARIGPTFKKDAGKVLEALKKASPEDVEAFEKEGSLEVDIGGTRVTITAELAAVKEVEETVMGEKVIPHVVEPSFGIDRIFYAVLESAYRERDGKTVLGLRPGVAPVKAAVFPLVKKNPLPEKAREIAGALREAGVMTVYDPQDSIGRRYARVDEVGVPYSITVDFEGAEEGTVTIRDRDTTEQKRIKVGEVVGTIQGLLSGEMEFGDLGD
jgi:glycyl-tRNA synthetase